VVDPEELSRDELIAVVRDQAAQLADQAVELDREGNIGTPRCRCVTNVKAVCGCNALLPERCCVRDGGRSSGVALQEEASNHRKLRR